MKKKLFFTYLSVFGMILVGCGPSTSDSGSISEAITPTAVAVSGNTTVKEGQAIQLSAVVSPEGASQEVNWTSKNEAVATVNASGLVTGVSIGSAVIEAASKSTPTIKGEYTITVEAADVSEGVTPNDTMHTREDDRVEAYGTFAPDGTPLGTHTSLYEAINMSVDEGDRGSYVTKLDVNDDDVKLFVNHAEYNESLGDQFWYYQNGNQLSAYAPWKSTYFQDSRELEATVIMNNPTDGLLTYYNGHELLYTNPEDVSSNNIAVWSIQKNLESTATVNLLAYSGITKAVYDLDLSDVRFAPSLNENQNTEAFFGFYSTDAYNTSHQHLRADTRTGDWYYGSGELNFDSSSDTYSVDKSVALMTSTWHEDGYYVPNESRVIVTFEKLTLQDNEGGEYVVDRIIFDFPESGRKVVRDYEISTLTQCGTLRFINGLDIMTGGVGSPDYMNGSYFTGLTVTEATVTAYEEMQDPSLYGNVAVLDAGEFDILNANEGSVARYHTVMYNPAFNNLDTSAGVDVYSHSYTADADNTAYNDDITNVKTLIAALPAQAEVVLADKENIEATRAAFDGLHLYEKEFITEGEKSALNAAEVGLAVASDPELGAVQGVLLSLGNIMDYTSFAKILEKKEQVDGLVASYEALAPAIKESLGTEVATQIADWEKAVNVPTDPALATSFATLFDVILGRTYDGIVLANWSIDDSAYVWEGDGAGNTSLVYVAGAGRTAINALKAAELYNNLPSPILADIEEASTNASGKVSFNIGLRYLKAYGDVATILDELAATLGWPAAWEIPFGDYPGYSNNPDLSVTLHGQDTTLVDFEAIRPQLDQIAEYWNDENIETWNFKNSIGHRTVTIVRRWDAYLKPLLADARCPYVIDGHGLALKESV